MMNDPIEKIKGPRGDVYDNLESFDANEMPYEMFMGKPGVISACAGTKIKNGRDTGEPCVVIGVKKKLPKNKLKKKDLIPEVLPDGVITDIIEVPEIREVGGVIPYNQKWRPVRGGISAIREGQTACTLGLVVKDSIDHKLVALTCNHCAGYKYDPNYDVPSCGKENPEGDNYLQPSPLEGGTAPDDVCGLIKRCVPIKFGGSNKVDAAISSINLSVEGKCSILEFDLGPIAFGSKDDYEIDTEVFKVGRTTGETPPPTALVIDKNTNVNVGYCGGSAVANFTNSIKYHWETGTFLAGGDSGSPLLIAGYKLIGINYAAGGNYGYAIPIEDIILELGIEEWDGEIVIDQNAANVIKVNGQCYEKVRDTIGPITHAVDDVYDNCADCKVSVTGHSPLPTFLHP